MWQNLIHNDGITKNTIVILTQKCAGDNSLNIFYHFTKV